MYNLLCSFIHKDKVVRYDQFIQQSTNSIQNGKKLLKDIHELVRENLINIELGDIEFKNSFLLNAFTTIDRAISDNKELSNILEEKNNDLRSEVDSYLSVLDEYAKLVQS